MCRLEASICSPVIRALISQIQRNLRKQLWRLEANSGFTRWFFVQIQCVEPNRLHRFTALMKSTVVIPSQCHDGHTVATWLTGLSIFHKKRHCTHCTKIRCGGMVLAEAPPTHDPPQLILHTLLRDLVLLPHVRILNAPRPRERQPRVTIPNSGMAIKTVRVVSISNQESNGRAAAAA